MRYNIVNNQVVESMFIDAPYDTRQDAQDALTELNQVTFKDFHAYGNQRIEIKLSNGIELILKVDDSGKLSVLCDTPWQVSQMADVVQTKGRHKGQSMPTAIVEVSGYGYPSD